MRSNKVTVVNLLNRFRNWEGVVKKTALFVLQSEKVKNCQLDIFFLPDEEMKKINKIYRRKNKVTNVLSFSYLKGKVERPDLKGRKFLGEIFLAPCFIKEKKDDVVKLTIHGVLHTLGYTHSNKKGSIIMREKEQQIFTKFSKKNAKNYYSN